jgi:hypothetical protein
MFKSITHTLRGVSDAYLFGYFGTGKGEGLPLDPATLQPAQTGIRIDPRQFIFKAPKGFEGETYNR